MVMLKISGRSLPMRPTISDDGTCSKNSYFQISVIQKEGGFTERLASMKRSNGSTFLVVEHWDTIVSKIRPIVMLLEISAEARRASRVGDKMLGFWMAASSLSENMMNTGVCDLSLMTNFQLRPPIDLLKFQSQLQFSWLLSADFRCSVE